ncbi:unnamed protein product [Malus baccata var. baccata]
MAFSRLERRTFSFSLLSCLFLVVVFTPPSDSGKVSLALYYESLFPYIVNFIVNYLVKLFKDDSTKRLCISSCVSNTSESSYREWQLCYEKLGLDSKPITECYSSGHACYVCNACNGTTALKACSKFSLSTMDGANEGSLGADATTQESSKSTRSVGCNEGNMAAVRGRIGSTITSWIRQMNLAILI